MLDFLNKISEINTGLLTSDIEEKLGIILNDKRIDAIRELFENNTIDNLEDDIVYDLLIFSEYINYESLKNFLIKHIRNDLFIPINDYYVYRIDEQKEKIYKIHTLSHELIDAINKNKFIKISENECLEKYKNYNFFFARKNG